MSDRDLPSSYDGDQWVNRADSGSRTVVIQEAAASEAAEPSPSAIWELVLRRKLTVVLTAAVAVILALVLTLLSDSVYQSRATFLLEQPGRGGGSALAMLDRVGQAASTETEIELLGSRRVVEPVVEKLGLHVWARTPDGVHRPDEILPYFDADRGAEPGVYRLRAEGNRVVVRWGDTAEQEQVVRASFGEVVNVNGLTFQIPPAREPFGDLALEVGPFRSAVQGIRGAIAAGGTLQNADVIFLTCSWNTPEMAHQLCEEVSASYLSLRDSLQRDEAEVAAGFLNEQLEEVRGRLTAAEDSLRRYRERVAAVSLRQQASMEVQEFASIRAQRDQLVAERNALRNMIERTTAEEGGSESFRHLASFPTFIRSRHEMFSSHISSLVTLENRRSELAVTRTEHSPELAAVNQRIRQIEGEVQSLIRSHEGALTAQISSLEEALENASRHMARIPRQEVELARLERQVELLTDLYSFLHTRLREAEVARAVTLPSVRIIDNASWPSGPSGPRMKRNLGLGGFLGLGLGLLLAFYREHTDSRIRGSVDLERRTGVPVLAMIPQLRRSVKDVLASRRGRLGSGDVRNGSRVPASVRDRTATLEAFQSLAVELEFVNERLLGGKQLRFVAVTSPGRGDGKTFTSCNLALTKARQGRRALLIDGDLRAARTSSLFGLSDQAGLRDLLSGRSSREEALQEIDVPAPGSLHVLPVGRANGSPDGKEAPLRLDSAELQALFETLSEEFEMVILDTPPLNVISDAAKLSALSDGVLVVVRGGRTEAAALQLTLKRLERARANVAGIILNGVELPTYYYTEYGT